MANKQAVMAWGQPLVLGRQVVDAVLGHEGGYVNNPADRGGETNWGITITTARRFGYAGAMRDMTREQAVEIYLQLFWNGRFSLVADAGMGRLAYVLMDFGVNSGEGRPAEAVQRALNALNKGGVLWPDMPVDGAIGPRTISCLRACGRSMPDAEHLLVEAISAIRITFLITLTERSPSQEAFMQGWLRRVAGVEDATQQGAPV